MRKNSRLESKLGYCFHDQSLLELALSHRSVGRCNNERLEFLGDSLLGFYIAEYLYQKFPNLKEGELTRLRSSLVKGETLAELAKEFNVGEYLNLGEGELKSGGFRRASILADSIEALIGAIYIEAGNEKCRSCVLSWFASRLSTLSQNTTSKDPKTRLQELMQEKGWPLPEYNLLEEVGESHAREFVVACKVIKLSMTETAKATSKKMAEKEAALKILQKLNEQT